MIRSCLQNKALILQRGQQLLFVSSIALTSSISSSPVLCQGKDNNDDDASSSWSKFLSQLQGNSNTLDALAKQAGQTVQTAVDSGIPTQLSYGFISGYCSGLAMKKVGRAAAGLCGLAFMGLQTLSYYGYITVNHVQLKKDVENIMDLNDDGIVDQEDGKIAWKKVLKVLEFNLPGGSGFAGGFIGGLRSG